MRELSLFSGAGGGLLGSLLLGWEPIGYVEFNDYCQRVIRQRILDGILPNAPIFGDIRTFLSDGYAEAYTGLVDVVSGGFPCQPFSVAGKRAGADDPRNMWPATIATIRTVRPRYAFLENVPGLVSSGYFGTILGDLAESGYDARWRILSAAELGAPHQRDRLWIVAHTESERTRRLPVRQGRQDQASTDTNGVGQDVAHATRQQDRRVQFAGVSPHVGASGQDMADAAGGVGYVGGRHGSLANAARHGLRSESWQVEPELGRLADGIPNRVDRLRAAGNAQVASVAATAWHLLTADLDA